MAKSPVAAIDAVLTVSQLKITRLSKHLQIAEQRLLEQQSLFDTLNGYAEEYRQTIANMDTAQLPLTQETLLRRQNLLAMIGKVDAMKSVQGQQVNLTMDELQRVKLAYQKARLYADNIEDLRNKKLLTLQHKTMKKQEKAQADEYLTRLSAARLL